jgi:hypothetical protein
MAILGESQDFPRIRTPFDGFLFGEAVPGQVFNVVFHPRVLAAVRETSKVVSGNHAEFAQFDQRTNFGSTQCVFPVSTVINGSLTVRTTARAR